MSALNDLKMSQKRKDQQVSFGRGRFYSEEDWRVNELKARAFRESLRKDGER